jgi:signal transduction histidine kinase
MDTRAAVRDPARLNALYRLGLLDSPAEENFDRLTRLVCHVLKVPVAQVTLVDANRQFFKSHCGMEEPWASARETPLTHSFCQYVVAGGHPLMITDSREVPYLSDNPAVSELNAIAYAGIPLTTPDGHVLGSFCVIHHEPHEWTETELGVLNDLAQSAISEIELKLRLSQLKEANEELHAYNHTVAHDLKNPLSAIGSSAELLLRYEQHTISPKGRRWIENISGATVQMRRMIDQLLHLTDLDTRINEIDEICVRQVAQRVMERFPNCNIELVIASDLPKAVACEAWVAEVLANLISNAIKYIGKHNPQPRVMICGVRDGSQVRYEVQDNGIGIKPQDQQRLFEMFSRVNTIEAEGLGLGLSIVRRLVTNMGGTVGVNSTPGQGSAFWFTLPAVQ